MCASVTIDEAVAEEIKRTKKTVEVLSLILFSVIVVGFRSLGGSESGFSRGMKVRRVVSGSLWDVISSVPDIYLFCSSAIGGFLFDLVRIE